MRSALTARRTEAHMLTLPSVCSSARSAPPSTTTTSRCLNATLSQFSTSAGTPSSCRWSRSAATNSFTNSCASIRRNVNLSWGSTLQAAPCFTASVSASKLRNYRWKNWHHHATLRKQRREQAKRWLRVQWQSARLLARPSRNTRWEKRQPQWPRQQKMHSLVCLTRLKRRWVPRMLSSRNSD